VRHESQAAGARRMRKPGLEPGRVTPQDPKSCASTNSATFAQLESNIFAALLVPKTERSAGMNRRSAMQYPEPTT
jgi:hypothetical protein